MISWYYDDKTEILFNKIPCIGVRYVLPSMSQEEIKSIKKYPFINKTELLVILKDKVKNKNYEFVIPKGYCYDGASIPRLFWRVIGSNTDNNFLVAALVHDVLCENHSYINNDRAFSTRVFDCLLKCSGVFPLKRFFMKNSVDIFQKVVWNMDKK